VRRSIWQCGTAHAHLSRKLLDSSRLAGMGWRARTSLRSGIEQSYAAFMAGDYREQ
jgi:GDP-L-fucose synthase